MAHILNAVGGVVADLIPVKRALISVSDKTRLIELATALSSAGVALLSTGGTAKAIKSAGLEVIDVSDYTGSPEILDGRVKTLHPKVHGGLLGVRGNEKHEAEMTENGIDKIDLVIMNLYPFEATVASGAEFPMCVENIDIGGPSMLRSSAKNHAYVTILTNVDQYDEFLTFFNANNGCTNMQFRKKCAAAAFATSATYDAHISKYFQEQLFVDAPTESDGNAIELINTRSYIPSFELKYGCNPHQKPAAIYTPLGCKLPFNVINGNPGYINLLDACNAWQLVYELKKSLDLPAAASFKHVSPAGAAVYSPLTDTEIAAFEIKREDLNTLSNTAIAYIRARNADPMCSFGDFAAISHVVDVSTAKVFKTEVCDGIIAPGFEPEALDILKSKKKGAFIVLEANDEFIAPTREFREVYGVGFSQKRNDTIITSEYLRNIVCGESTLSTEVQRDMILATIALKYTQSNSVGYAYNGQMVGVGAGQQSRVDCTKLAGRKVDTWYLRQHPKVQNLPFKDGIKRQARVNARVRYIEGDITPFEYETWITNFHENPEPLTLEEKIEFMSSFKGATVSSDAFFPFRDSIDHASKHGVTYVCQPGGSVADEDVINACKGYGMTMCFTNVRLFHH